MVLGPLDKRALRTRCQACARRRIKCEGGSPCTYCMKKKITCVPPPATKRADVVFINKTSKVSTKSTPEEITEDLCTRSTPITSRAISPKVPHLKTDHFVAHFFTVFIVRNDFSASLDTNTIVASFQSSPSLYHVAVAVGALDASKKSTSSVVAKGEAKMAALTSYRTAIATFQKEIQRRDIKTNDAALWTTLFLGLFELMTDITGSGWITHILYGSSRLLQLRGPSAHLTGRGRSFFLTFRVFEICRSLIFPERSFLCEEPWKQLMSQMWEEDGADWHPKEGLFDLMLECGALSEKVWEVVKEDADVPEHLLDDVLVGLAIEGHRLRSGIGDWYTAFLQYSQTSKPELETDEPWTLLASIYYSAVSIFLAGIFDYRRQFDPIPSPVLPTATIQTHVRLILSQTKLALKTTNLAGALFVFPLRVAGARAQSEVQKESILAMLVEISGRSFVVAEAFKSDLEAFWGTERVRRVDKEPWD